MEIHKYDVLSVRRLCDEIQFYVLLEWSEGGKGSEGGRRERGNEEKEDGEEGYVRIRRMQKKEGDGEKKRDDKRMN